MIVCAEVLCYSVLENVKNFQSSFLLVNTIFRKSVSACLCVILLHIIQTSHNTRMCWICVLQISKSLENGEYRIMVSFIIVCLCDILHRMWDKRFWYYFLLNRNENNSGSMWVIFRREETDVVNIGNTKFTAILDAMPYCLFIWIGC